MPRDRIVGVQGPCYVPSACASPEFWCVNSNHGRSLHPRVLTDLPVPEAACPPRPCSPRPSRFLCLNACIVKSARTVALPPNLLTSSLSIPHDPFIALTFPSTERHLSPIYTPLENSTSISRPTSLPKPPTTQQPPSLKHKHHSFPEQH